MQTYAQELAEKTRWYWRISSQLRDRSLEQIPAFRAISICNNIVDTMNMQRPLPHRMRKLRAECIMCELNPNPDQTAVVIPMRRAV